MIKTISALSLFIVLAYLAYILGSLLLFVVFDHNDLVSLFTQLYPSAYRVDEYDKIYFSPAHYQFVAHNIVLFALCPVALISLLIWQRNTFLIWIAGLTADVTSIKNIIAVTIVNRSRREQFLVVACFLTLGFIKVYFFFELPFHVDEIFNFVYFTDQGIFHSSTFANNHVLTNILSAIWWKTGISPELSFRLPSILSSVFVHLLIYSVTTYYFNFRAGVFALMLSGLTFWGNVYSIEGVAYMLMTLWAFVALTSTVLMDEDPNRGNSLFIVSSVLGFYTSQLFILPFIALVIFRFSLRLNSLPLHSNLRELTVAVTLVAIASTLLYFPMYLWSGFGATFHSGMPRYDLIYMSPVLFEDLSVMTDVNSKSYIVFAGLAAVAISCFRNASRRIRGLLVLQGSIIISILIFSLAIGLYPPSRALVFANILFFASMGVILSDWVFNRLKTQLAVGALCVILFFKAAIGTYLFSFGWQHIPLGLQDKNGYESLVGLSNELLAHSPHVIFSDVRDTHLNFQLTFLARKNHQQIKFVYDSERMSEADVVILDDQSTIAEDGYQQIAAGDFGRVFVRK